MRTKCTVFIETEFRTIENHYSKVVHVQVVVNTLSITYIDEKSRLQHADYEITPNLTFEIG